MTNCAYCEKKLVSIGISRKGGKVLSNHNGDDWVERKFHKKCWKHLKELQDAWLMGVEGEELKQRIVQFKNLYNLEKLL